MEDYKQQMEERNRLIEKIKTEGVGAGAKWETIATAAMAGHQESKEEVKKMLGREIQNFGDYWELQSAAYAVITYGERQQSYAEAIQDLEAGVCSAPRDAESYIANPLQRARKAAGLTQKELAEQTGIPLTLIQKLENGTREMAKVNVDYALKIARALGTTAEDLFAGAFGGRN